MGGLKSLEYRVEKQVLKGNVILYIVVQVSI